MITKLGKALAIATAIFSLAALGTVLVAVSGGPNWRAEGRILTEYDITRNDGPPPTYTAKTRTPRLNPDGTMGVRTPANNVAVLPDAIVKARQDLLKEQQDELTALDRDIPAQKVRNADAASLIEKDLVAINKRNADLTAEFDRQSTEIDKVSNDAVATSQQAQAVQAERDARRNDVFRLRNELAALRTDRFRLDEQRRQLEDLLVRVKGNNARLERRERQLLAAGATDPKGYDEAAANPAPPGDPKPDETKPDDAKPE